MSEKALLCAGGRDWSPEFVPGETGHAGLVPPPESLLWQTLTSPSLESANTTSSLPGSSQR